jgi:hypothetical protein
LFRGASLFLAKTCCGRADGTETDFEEQSQLVCMDFDFLEVTVFEAAQLNKSRPSLRPATPRVAAEELAEAVVVPAAPVSPAASRKPRRLTSARVSVGWGFVIRHIVPEL